MYRLLPICSIWNLIWEVISVNIPRMDLVSSSLLLWGILRLSTGEISHPLCRSIFVKIFYIVSFSIVTKCSPYLRIQGLTSMIIREFSSIIWIKVQVLNIYLTIFYWLLMIKGNSGIMIQPQEISSLIILLKILIPS